MSDYKPIDLEAFLQMVENVCKYEDCLSYQVIEEGVKRQMAMREAVIDHCDREPRFSKVRAEMREKILNELVVPKGGEGDG